MNYKDLILNKLLDKFEKSKSYLENVNRRIILKLENVKEYNIQNYEEKMLFHEIVKDLKNKGLVNFSWVKFEQENTLLGKEKHKEIIRALQEIDWLQCSSAIAYYDKLAPKEETEQGKAETKGTSEDLREEIKEEAKQSKTIAKNTMLKRIFSIKCYNNSKYFEKEVQSNLIKIIKRYYKKENLDLTELNDDELLAEIGIVRYPEVLEFCGNMKCTINGKEFEFSDVSKGSYINSYSVLNMKNLKLIGIKKVVFIENKTNYISYIENKEKDEFVIYHGGVYSPIKGEFFRKIYEAVKNNFVEIYNNKKCINEDIQNNYDLNKKSDVEFLHWSDIDIGGFNIFTRLRDNIIEELQPFKMDLNTLIKYKNSWQSFDKDYKSRLLKLKNDSRFECFYDVIDFMVEKSVRLEQESII